MKQSHHIDIAAPPEKVFAVLGDPNNLVKWAAGVVENENLNETEEKVGTTFRQVYEERGRRMEFQGVVTRYEENQAMGVHLEGSGFDLDVDYRLEPRDGGTHLVQNSDVHFKGLWKIMGFLMLPFMKKAGCEQLDQDFGRLKAMCEA